jgi:hypothetical protein
VRQTHSYLPPPEMRTAAKASLYPAIKVLSLSNASSMPRRTSPSAVKRFLHAPADFSVRVGPGCHSFVRHAQVHVDLEGACDRVLHP